MNRQILVTIILVILIVFLIPLFLTFNIKEIPNDLQPPLDHTQKIYQTNIVVQEFVASGDRLSSIGVSVKNPNLANKKDLTFKLLDSNDQILRTIVKSGLYIEDGNFIKFSFDPVVDSNGKPYKFVFESSDSNLSDAFQVFIDANSGSVSYVSFYQRANIFSIALRIFSGWFLKIYADFYFFIFYMTVVFGFLIYLVTFRKYSSG